MYWCSRHISLSYPSKQINSSGETYVHESVHSSDRARERESERERERERERGRERERVGYDAYYH